MSCIRLGIYLFNILLCATLDAEICMVELHTYFCRIALLGFKKGNGRTELGLKKSISKKL